MQMLQSRRGQAGGVFNFLIGGVLGLAVLGLIVVFTLAMLANVDDNFTAGSAEANAATATVNAIDDVPDYMGLLVIGVIFVALIGLVIFIIRRVS